MLSIPGSYQTCRFAGFNSTSRNHDNLFVIVIFFNLIESIISNFTLVKKAKYDDTVLLILVCYHHQQMPKFHKIIDCISKSLFSSYKFNETVPFFPCQ